MWKDPIVEEVRNVRAQLAVKWQNARGGIAGAQKIIFDQWTGGKVRYDEAHRKIIPKRRVAEEHSHYGMAKEPDGKN